VEVELATAQRVSLVALVEVAVLVVLVTQEELEHQGKEMLVGLEMRPVLVVAAERVRMALMCLAMLAVTGALGHSGLTEHITLAAVEVLVTVVLGLAVLVVVAMLLLLPLHLVMLTPEAVAAGYIVLILQGMAVQVSLLFVIQVHKEAQVGRLHHQVDIPIIHLQVQELIQLRRSNLWHIMQK
jgi:hypothetical protein